MVLIKCNMSLSNMRTYQETDPVERAFGRISFGCAEFSERFIVSSPGVQLYIYANRMLVDTMDAPGNGVAYFCAGQLEQQFRV